MRIGGYRRQAWVTCVTRSEKCLELALVLAESLRRTNTTKRIAVITTSQVGKPETETLYNAFDDVFCLNDNLILPFHKSREQQDSDDVLADELRGKIFAFSLEMYDKCVFLSPDMIMLENCDKLFGKTEFPGPHLCGESDNMFLLSPKWHVCQYLKERYEQSMHHAKNVVWNNFITKSMQAWMDNNELGELSKDNVDSET